MLRVRLDHGGSFGTFIFSKMFYSSDLGKRSVTDCTLQPTRLPLQECFCEKLGHVFWPEIR